MDAYDHFDNIQELVNFVVGTGSYEDTRSFTPGEKDMEDLKREVRQEARPQCPECLKDIEDYMRQGAMKGEINIDPYMQVNVWETEEDAMFNEEYDVRVTAHAMAYCEDHKEESFMLYEESWYEEKE